MEDLLEWDGAVRELVERRADQSPRGKRVEVDLHAERAAGVLGGHLAFVQSSDERRVPLAVDQPVLLEREDHDDVHAGALALAHRLGRLQLEAVVARHPPRERRCRIAPNLHGPKTLHEVGGRFGERCDRPDADVFGVEELQPLGKRAGLEDRRELGRERLLVGVELTLGQLRPADQLRQAAEEDRLERARP